MRWFSRRRLRCVELVELVTDYLEGVLAPGDARRFELHLAACRGCEAYLAQIRETIRSTGRLADEDVPVAGRAVLVAAFEAARADG